MIYFYRIHPLAGQGFNMTIRDINIILNIINSRIKLGLELDYSVNVEFQNKLRHKNYIFSSGIDLVHEFFNFERKIENGFLSKSIQFFGNKPFFNKMLIKMADKGITF